MDTQLRRSSERAPSKQSSAIDGGGLRGVTEDERDSKTLTATVPC